VILLSVVGSNSGVPSSLTWTPLLNSRGPSCVKSDAGSSSSSLRAGDMVRRFLFWNRSKPSASRGGEYGSLGGEYREILRRPRDDEVRVKDCRSAALPGLHVLDRAIVSWNWSSSSFASHGSISLLEYLTLRKSSFGAGCSCCCWNS